MIRRTLQTTLGLMLAVSLGVFTADAQQADPPAAGAAANEAAPAEKQASGKYRKLAPGVLRDVDPEKQAEETYSWHDVVELLAVDQNFDWAKNVAFRRDIWTLEFRFKPVRMIWVDVPQANGKMRRKLIWYMVYSVTNPGKAMKPVKKEDGTYDIEYVDRPVRFIPLFQLEAPEFNKVYPDRVIPVALGPIRLREDPNRKFLSSVEISREIGVGETVWGVAMWEDVDPRIDRFSVYIQGLTNAYKWKDDAAKVQPGKPLGTGRRLSRKILKLNFWRPGDEYLEKEDEIRFGMPGEVDYEWIYQ